jgi:hypothetical protein
MLSEKKKKSVGPKVGYQRNEANARRAGHTQIPACTLSKN